MIRFANWQFLVLIPILILYLLWVFKKKRKQGLKFSSVKLLHNADNKKIIKHLIGKFLVLLAIILSITAMARPQTTMGTDYLQKLGIDIAMILDISGSMQSVDFNPNRLEAARKTVDEFIAQRSSDRISLIVFAGAAYTRIPLTLDHNIVRESLAQVTTESINTDGTAIGMAISVGLNRLKKSDGLSRVIILLTDGDNNAGEIDPVTASKLAQELGIRIYAIGVGSDVSIFPVRDMFGQTHLRRVPGGFNEELLKQISDNTGGQYFRANDPEALSQIFETINKLEKTEFIDDNFREYNELAFLLIKVALFALMAGIFIDKYYFVQIP